MEIVEYAFKRGAATRITERLITMLKSDWAHKQTWKMFNLCLIILHDPQLAFLCLVLQRLTAEEGKTMLHD